jgi:glucosylceramidase
MKQTILTLLSAAILLNLSSCNMKDGQTIPSVNIQVWTTNADQTALLQQKTIEFAKNKDEKVPVITIDANKKFQTVDGFGYTLTSGSTTLISKLGKAEKAALLQELFGNKTNSIGISYLRIAIGASDLSASVFSYDDLPNGETDMPLAKFNLSQDTIDFIPILKEILAINPNIKILATPWSPPTWMKTNNNSMGGSLKPECYDVYARYFVKYIQEMKAKGIPIDAITLQNEPHHGGNNPSMVLNAPEAANFVKNNLGPAFKTANIKTKIIVWDHNCDEPIYPITVLNDAGAKQFINGSAFHLYNGDISALSQVYAAHPDKDLYFTEQWTGSKGEFAGDLKWHLKNVVIGSMRNRSRTALEWNLANDAAFEPHTPGGCTECKGALTIQNNTITRNVAYYIIAQISKFVPAGSVRIESNIVGDLQNVAFKTPAGKTVLVVLNEGKNAKTFNINADNKWITATIAGDAAATYVW